MKRLNHNKKLNKTTILLFAVMFIGLGFAALSATLGITGLARVGHISFDVHFANVSVNEGSMEAVMPAKITGSDNTQIDFSLILTKPGEYYEFEADIVNSGTLDAYLSSIEVLGLDESMQKYLSIDYRYTNGGIISIGDLLPVNSIERIVVRVDFLYDITLDIIPDEGTEVDFTLNLTYTQDGGKRDDRLHSIVVSKSEGLDNVASRHVESETGIDFHNEPSNTNGKGVYLRAGTQNDAYPVYYYRGNVNDDNVLFGGFCWKIVRTTEQGGTKLVYNGVPNEEYLSEKLDESEYINNSQDYWTEKQETIESYTFDDNTKMWTNSKHESYSTSLMEFSLPSSGEYVLDYTISSTENYDMAYVYVNGKVIVDGVSGLSSSQVYLGKLNASDVIEVYYERNSYSSMYDDTLSFSIGKVNGRMTKSCNNIREDALIDYKPSLNNKNTTLADVGYMYGERYEPVMWNDDSYIYGSDVSYKDGVYTLEEPSTNDDLDKHYTCKLESTDGTCSIVYYVYYRESYYEYPTQFVNTYAIPLNNGETIETVFEKSFSNDNESEVKKVVDKWFEENLLNQEDKMEDAVWCNDRSIASGGYLKTEPINYHTFFGANRIMNEDYEVVPTIKDDDACPNQRDRFTKNDTEVGNGKLKYSVGLLTADEATITGYHWGSYLSTAYLTMSPFDAYPSWERNGVALFKDEEGDEVPGDDEDDEQLYGVRPSIVIKNEIKVLHGDGTATNPYVVDSYVAK